MRLGGVTSVIVACVMLCASGAFAVIAANARRSDLETPHMFQALTVNTKRTGPRILHRGSVSSPGGRLRIEWYDSNWEPTTNRTMGAVSLYVDGRIKASTIKGSGTGYFQDGPARLVWVGNVSRGKHLVEVRFHVPVGWARYPLRWGVPYTDPGNIGLDSLSVTALP